MNAKLIACCSAVMMIFATQAAVAGAGERVSTNRPEAPELETALAKYQKKIDDLNETGLSVSDYRRLASVILEDFISEREPLHKDLRATEILKCKVEAQRPGLWKGKNRDSCKISNDLSFFEGWDFVGKEERLIHQYEGGSNTHDVKIDDETGSVVLSASCISPSHDDFTSGRCGRTQELTIIYRKSPDLIERDVRLEANNLVFF